MKQKSLRQLARELGVSASYLSQVNHGKKHLSQKVARMLTSVNRNVNLIPMPITAGAEFPAWRPAASNPLGGTLSVFGGFDSHALPPDCTYTLLSEFLKSRRQGLGLVNREVKNSFHYPSSARRWLLSCSPENRNARSLSSSPPASWKS
jgi:hypothetical protein